MKQAEYIYTMRKITRFFPPDKEVLKDITLSFLPGAKIGVLGANGAGKSSLLKIMAGLDDDYTGEARLISGYSVGFLPQEPMLDESKTVIGNVMEGVGEIASLLTRYDEIITAWSDPSVDQQKLGEEQANLLHKIEAADAWDLQRTVEIAMDALRLPPSDSEVSDLSGGECRRVALCRLLLSQPDLLLLDEPTNHLDAESVAWLEQHLKVYAGTVVAITHDRYFLDNVAEWILELHRGQGIPYKGNYSGWLEQKEARLKEEEGRDSARQRTLNRELEWVRMTPRARQAKGKARLEAYEKLLADSKAAQRSDTQLQINIPVNQRLGDLVIEATNLSKSFGDKVLFENLSFSLPPASIVGVIGANGAGKTTLFKMITGKEEIDSGDLRIGPTVDIGLVDQSRATLDDDKTVFEEITDGVENLVVGDREIQSRAYVASLNFRGSDQQKRVGLLSGGERNRVQLAKVLRTGANVLLLDEPTNDLDVDTLRALEGGLEDYAGCAVIISHDRWFLDRLATHILAFEGNSQVRWFEGNFSEYEAFQKAELGIKNQPTRIKYKPLTR